MPFTDDDICKITTSVWESILGLDIQQCAETVVNEEGADRFMTGAVRLTGAWEGTVAVHCTEDLVRQAASVMFGRASKHVTASETRDALGELANMISGNLKTLLPAPSTLSLPSVMDGRGALAEPEGELRSQIGWDCEGKRLIVTV